MEVPVTYRDHHARVLRGEGGRALAVKLKCLDCCGWQRAEVRDCRVATCPLWHWRPFQRDEEE